MTNDSKWLNSDLFKFGSVIIIALGYLKLTYFYNQFGVNIFNYIDISELFVIFLTDTIYCGLLLFCLYALVNVNAITKTRVDFIPPFKKSRFSVNNSIKSNLIAISLFIILLIVAPYLYLNIKYYFKSTPILILINGTILFGLITTRIDVILNKSHNDNVIKLIEYLIYLFVLSFYILLRANYDVISIKHGESKMHVDLEFYTETLHISGDTIPIGQTSKFLFLYLKHEDATLIIKKENLEKIKINNLE